MRQHDGKVRHYSFADSTKPWNPTGVIERQSFGYDEDYENNNRGVTKVASCPGVCVRGTDGKGFDEAGLDKTANAIDRAKVNYDAVTRNSNSATYTMCVLNGGGFACDTFNPSRYPAVADRNRILPLEKK